MEYQKLTNLLDNKASNQASKFKTKNWVEINDDWRIGYSPNKQTKFKMPMLRSSLCNYSDAYILVKRNISVNNSAGAGVNGNNTNKKALFKKCAPFSNCISKINNTEIDSAQYIDILMPMSNLIEYSDNYSKTSGSLWQYSKEIPVIPMLLIQTDNSGQTDNNGRINNVEIMVPLRCLSNFWRTLKMSLINCEVELILNWSADCVNCVNNVENQVSAF